MVEYYTNEIQQLGSDLSRIYGVSEFLHSEDMLLQFLLDNPCFPDKKSAINYYFKTGKDSVDNLISILKELGTHKPPISLLEFASGYGCVSRHLIKKPDLFNLTSCDIHTEAMVFLTQRLGVDKIIPSARTPEDFSCEGKYDVVFALSFFSHMPKNTWGRWLVALYDKVKAGGHLIFTTHGMKSTHHFGNPTIPSDGFWYQSTSEQKDLDASDYGQTICT